MQSILVYIRKVDTVPRRWAYSMDAVLAFMFTLRECSPKGCSMSTFKGSHQTEKDDSARSPGGSLPGKAFW